MFSVIIPCDTRFDLLEKTMSAYRRLHPGMQRKYKGLEFIVVTRADKIPVVVDKAISYKHPAKICNPAMALNLGIREAANDTVIITCPEIMPLTPVLDQFAAKKGKNVIAQVFEDNRPLINSTFRSEYPGLYFLAMYNKKDIVAINGWDEDFMVGVGWEDTDFGARFVRAHCKYEIDDEIQAIHQKHPRDTEMDRYQSNQTLFSRNNDLGVVKPKNGLYKL